MSEPLDLLFGTGTGVLLGVFFFGGLWWTLQRACIPGSPASRLLPSLIVRGLVVMGVLLTMAPGGGAREFAALLGFMGGRSIIFRMTRVAS